MLKSYKVPTKGEFFAINSLKVKIGISIIVGHYVTIFQYDSHAKAVHSDNKQMVIID